MCDYQNIKTGDIVELLARVDERTSRVPEMQEDIADLRVQVGQLPNRDEIKGMIKTEVTGQVNAQVLKCHGDSNEQSKKGVTIRLNWPRPRYWVTVLLAALAAAGVAVPKLTPEEPEKEQQKTEQAE